MENYMLHFSTFLQFLNMELRNKPDWSKEIESLLCKNLQSGIELNLDLNVFLGTTGFDYNQAI